MFARVTTRRIVACQNRQINWIGKLKSSLFTYLPLWIVFRTCFCIECFLISSVSKFIIHFGLPSVSKAVTGARLNSITTQLRTGFRLKGRPFRMDQSLEWAELMPERACSIHDQLLNNLGKFCKLLPRAALVSVWFNTAWWLWHSRIISCYFWISWNIILSGNSSSKQRWETSNRFFFSL